MPASVSFAVMPLAVVWTSLARYPGQVEFESVEFWRGYSGENGLAMTEEASAIVAQTAVDRRVILPTCGWLVLKEVLFVGGCNEDGWKRHEVVVLCEKRCGCGAVQFTRILQAALPCRSHLNMWG